MRDTSHGVVAAFDVDGTLTRHDTLLPFLRFLCGPRAVGRTLVRHAGPLLRALGTAARGGHAGRGRVKAAVLEDLLAGRDDDEVRAAGESFAHRLARGSRLRPDTVTRWQWHRAEGHRIVVVSASLEAYVEPLARRLGGAYVLATRLRAAPDGTLTGELDGDNCSGAEKVRRLRDWGVHADVELWAYGNSSGDRELLTAAQRPHRLRRGSRIRTPPPGAGAGLGPR